MSGTRETDIRGDDVRTIGGECRATHETNRFSSVASNDELVVGQDLVHTVGRDALVSTNERFLVGAGGNAEIASSEDIKVSATSGTISLESGEADGVKLGRNPHFHAVNYEPLAQAVAVFLAEYNAFKILVSTFAAATVAHTHTVASTPAGLVANPPNGIPPVPGTPGQFNISTSKSDEVVL